MKYPAVVITVLSICLIASTIFLVHLVNETKSSITSGTITAKTYVPESETSAIVCGHPAICAPIDTVEPEKWFFSLESYQDGKAVSGWVQVPESVYDNHEVGDSYRQG